MRRSDAFRMALAALLVGGGGSGAQASGLALPPYAGSVMCTTTSFVTGKPVIKSVFDHSSCNLQGANGSVTLGPNPNVAGAVSVDPSKLNDASVDANLTYSVSVVGGVPGTDVPLIFAFSLLARPTAGDVNAVDVDSQIVIRSVGGVDEFAVCSLSFVGGCGVLTGQTKYDASVLVHVTSGSIDTTVSLTGVVEAQISDYDALHHITPGGVVSADPYIYVDPSFPNAADYAVVVSPGVGNSLPGVPEPATWAMMILGVAAIGSAARSRAKGAARMA